jgi:hypothetical protein
MALVSLVNTQKAFLRPPLIKPRLITNFVKAMKRHGDGSRDLVPKYSYDQRCNGKKK